MIVQYYKYTPGRYDITWKYIVIDIGKDWSSECQWLILPPNSWDFD